MISIREGSELVIIKISFILKMVWIFPSRYSLTILFDYRIDNPQEDEKKLISGL